MSALHKSLDDYLKVRRALGFKLENTEWCLRRFVHFRCKGSQRQGDAGRSP